MATNFCEETPYLDGHLVKILNRKDRLLSYRNCTEDSDITVSACFTVRSRACRDPNELNRVRGCPHTLMRRTDKLHTNDGPSADERRASGDGSAAAAAAESPTGGTIHFKAVMTVPPQTTRPFVEFDLVDDVMRTRVEYTTNPCALDRAAVRFAGGRRRTDQRIVTGPDGTLVPRIDAIYRCLGNPRDSSGATNWLYRLAADVVATPTTAAVPASPNHRTQLWAFYNDSTHVVAHITAVFHLGQDESVEARGETTVVDAPAPIVPGKTVKQLKLAVEPLTTELFARVTRRRGSSLDSPFFDSDSDDDDNANVVGAAVVNGSARKEESLLEYNLDDLCGIEESGTEKGNDTTALSAASGVGAFVSFNFHTAPCRTILPLTFDEIRQVTLPTNVEYDEVIPCPLVIVQSATSGTSGDNNNNNNNSNSSPDTSVDDVGQAGRRSPSQIVVATPRATVRDSGSPVSVGQRATAARPSPSQRRLSHSSGVTNDATTTTATSTTSTDVFLLVDSEAKQWHLHNRSATTSYLVYVTVYSMGSVEDCYAVFVTPGRASISDDPVVHVRRGRSQPDSIVVEVSLAPSVTLLLCDGVVPVSFDMACVVDNITPVSVLVAPLLSVPSASEPGCVASQVTPPLGHTRSSMLLDTSNSIPYMSIEPTNQLFFESPSMMNLSLLQPLGGEQYDLPNQELLRKGTVTFDGPGPDEAVFPYLQLYALFPRRVGAMATSRPHSGISTPAYPDLPVQRGSPVAAAAAGDAKLDSEKQVVPPIVPPLSLREVSSHLGTNGVLFRLVSEDGTQWGLYNDATSLSMIVHVIFTMDQNVFGQALELPQRALGHTRLLTTPWQSPAARAVRASPLPQPPKRSGVRAPTDNSFSLLVSEDDDEDDGKYATPLSGRQNANLAVSPARRRKTPTKVSSPSRRADGAFPTSPPSNPNLAAHGAREAGHLAHTLLHALVLVPPQTTVPFLAGRVRTDLDGCRFHVWTEPITTPTLPVFTHAAELKEACAAKGFTCDAAFPVCHSRKATLYKLVESPALRLVHAAEEGPTQSKSKKKDDATEAAVTVLDSVAAEALTRSRWAFFNDSDTCCFTVTLTFPLADGTTVGSADVYTDVDVEASEHDADWGVITATVTGVADGESSQSFGGTPATVVAGSVLRSTIHSVSDSSSPSNRLRVIQQYASGDNLAPPSSAHVSRMASFPGSPRGDLFPSVVAVNSSHSNIMTSTGGTPTTAVRATVWPKEMLIFVETAVDTKAASMHVRADRPPQNKHANVAFETSNPVIYRNLADYTSYQRESRARAADATELPEHLKGVGAVQPRPHDGRLHVDDMLSKHYLRFYRDYQRAPVYRIINDRDRVWSVFNDDSQATYSMRIVFSGQSKVQALGAAKDVTERERKRAAAHTGERGRSDSLNAAPEAPPVQRRLSDKNAEKSADSSADASRARQRHSADALLYTLLSEDTKATVVDVLVAPGATELIVHVDDVRRYVVFLLRQPRSNASSGSKSTN